MNYDPLNRYLAKRERKIYPKSFSEVRTAAKEKYGERAWIGKTVTASTGLTSKDGRAYQSARKQIERWNAYEKTGKYNPDKATPEAKKRLEKAGRKLDPIRKEVPKGGLNVIIQFRETGGKRGQRQPIRETPNLHLTYQEALQYVNQSGQPDYTFLFNLWGERMIGSSLFGESGAYPAEVLDVF